MAAAELDLRSLAGSALAAVLAAVLLAGVWYFGSSWLAERQNAYRRARGTLAHAASQFRNASDDQAVYQQYAARFRAMAERGWIGPEQRLSWIEALQRINKDLELPVLHYQIDQQRMVPLDGASFDTRNLQLYRTPMTLEIGAPHEGDVIELLERMAERGRGIAVVDHCALRRGGRSGQVRMDAGAQNVHATCSLNWYTLQLEQEERSS